jgi:hypothetical protein
MLLGQNGSITRRQAWTALGRPVREDSSDANLFKLLLVRELSTGDIIAKRTMPTTSSKKRHRGRRHVEAHLP